MNMGGLRLRRILVGRFRRLRSFLFRNRTRIMARLFNVNFVICRLIYLGLLLNRFLGLLKVRLLCIFRIWLV